MSFYEKETALMSKMKEDGFNTLFNGDVDEAVEYVTTHIQSIINYVMGHTKNNLNVLIRGKEAAGEEAMNSDKALFHEAKTGIAAINRLSNMLGMGDLFEVDLEDAAAIKKFLDDTAMEFFQRLSS